ncbi:hypothetical protein J7K27_05890 [Candidatus Bathyarchaeota archaeon]|nr:hypothetical protein [Candidatus Bathyarchaeota archaeon]
MAEAFDRFVYNSTLKALMQDRTGTIYRILRKAIKLHEENKDKEYWIGFEWYEVPPAAPQTLNQLVREEILKISYKSNKCTAYKLADELAVRKALEDFEKMAETEEEEKIPEDLFDVILGYEDVKDIFWRSLKSDRPVHILLYGPVASIPGHVRVVVRTEKGVETPEIRQVYERFIKGEKFEALSVNPVTLRCEWKKVYNVYKHSSKEPIIKVKLVTGRVVEATKNHSFVVYDSNLNMLVPKKGSELKVGDILPVVGMWYGSGRNKIAIDNVEILLTYDLGFMIGLWVAEGSVNEKHNLVSIVNNDIRLLEKCREILLKHFPRPKATNYKGGYIRVLKNRGAKQYIIQHPIIMKMFRQFIYRIGNKPIKGRYARYKILPPWVLDANKDFIRGLLRGYFTGDGTILKNGTIYATTASEPLAYQISLLLSRMGIVPVIRSSFNKKYGWTYWNIIISKRDAKKFIEEIGFENRQKQVRAINVLRNAELKHDELFSMPVPFNPVHPEQLRAVLNAINKSRQHGYSYITMYGFEQLLKLSEEALELKKLAEADVRWIRITEISEEKEHSEVYDLEVEDNENFLLANGVFVHNSAKSLFLLCLSRLPRSEFVLGSSLTKAGLIDLMFTREPKYLIIDEIDKVDDQENLTALLSLMQTGIISVTKYRRRFSKQFTTWVFASANRVEKIPVELMSRFLPIRFKEYGNEEFIKVSVHVLTKIEGINPLVAKYIANKVLFTLGSRDVRDCVKIARLIPKLDDINKMKTEVDKVIKVIKARR